MAHPDQLKLSSFPQNPMSFAPNNSMLQTFPSRAAMTQLNSIQTLLGKRDLFNGPFNEDLSLEKKVKVEQQDYPVDLSSLTRQDTDMLRTDMNMRNMGTMNNTAHQQEYLRLQALQQAQYLKVLNSLNSKSHFPNSSFMLPKNGTNTDAIIPSQLLNKALNKMPIVNPVFKNGDDEDQNDFSQVKTGDLSKTKVNLDHKIHSKEKKNRLESYRSMNQEPVLAEFTKAYPDWDLCTIFEFIKSGKSREIFEGERRTRMKNKTLKERRKVLKQNLVQKEPEEKK